MKFTQAAGIEWLRTLGIVLITPGVVFAGYIYGDLQKDREIGLRYVEIAISILREKPNEEQRELRKWAVDTLNEHAKIKLPENVKQDLERIPLPLSLTPHLGGNPPIIRAPYIIDDSRQNTRIWKYKQKPEPQ